MKYFFDDNDNKILFQEFEWEDISDIVSDRDECQLLQQFHE